MDFGFSLFNWMKIHIHASLIPFVYIFCWYNYVYNCLFFCNIDPLKKQCGKDGPLLKYRKRVFGCLPAITGHCTDRNLTADLPKLYIPSTIDCIGSKVFKSNEYPRNCATIFYPVWILRCFLVFRLGRGLY